MMADRLGPLVIKMRKTTTVICLVLINSMLASSQNETSNYRKIIKNTDWLINSHTINDSFVKNLNEIFFSFNDSNYFWLKTENNLLGTIKDTNALSGGNWHIDSNNLLVLESHLENRMWFQLAQRFWTYKISYISKDTIKLVPITHPFVEMLLTRVPKLKYSKPKFDRSEQFIWPPSISYWNLNQKHLKIISKSDKGRLKVPIGEIVTIWTIKEINTNLSARYTGNLFTCDSQNIYLKMNNKFQSWNNGDNIMTNITTEYPYSSDTVLYSSLRYSLIEKIPYKNIYSM